MHRRTFLHATSAAAASAVLRPARPLTPFAPSAVPFAPSDFDEATITELQAAFDSGKLTARALTEHYLQRIDAVDRRGPALRAVLETNPDALALAEALDDERKAKGARGPLHGIPILVKDNIDTADRMTTTAGSLALEGSIAERDAFVAERLRAAGAILLGKTNLSEWANFRSTHSSSGWSGRGGQTRNPYVLDRTPCGSSSGSAAAVAADYCAAAIGTETDGSIVCPSAACSLVGLKPTIGLVSRAGIIPIAHSQDTAGPMTRTVADAAIVLGAIAGIDPRDAATRASRGHGEAAYTKFLVADGLRRARLGVDRANFFGYNEETDRLIDEALDQLRQAGAVLVDVTLPSAKTVADSEFEVLLYEFKADLNRYLAALSDDATAHTLLELIAFNETHRDREMPFFQQEIFRLAQAKTSLKTPAYHRALAHNLRVTRTEGIDAVIARHHLDAIVAPTGGPPWPIDLVNGDPAGGGSASTLPAVAGYPHITVPAGYVFGLPVGLSFFGRAWSEPTLLRLAYAYEQRTQMRQSPRYRTRASIENEN